MSKSEPTVEERFFIMPLMSGMISIIKDLLEAGAKPNIQDNDGKTPLHWAARCGSTSIINLLLKAGAKPDIQDNDGKHSSGFGSYQGLR